MPIREGMVVQSQTTAGNIRRLLGVIVLMVGLSMTWAWGEVARLAEPAVVDQAPEVTALYAAWQPEGTGRVTLFRSTDAATTWQPLALPGDTDLSTWADDGGTRVAVGMADGSLLWSEDQGDSWTVADQGLSVLSLAWDDEGGLYLGTDGQGVYRLSGQR